MTDNVSTDKKNTILVILVLTFGEARVTHGTAKYGIYRYEEIINRDKLDEDLLYLSSIFQIIPENPTLAW
jgi:hypothetical protein